MENIRENIRRERKVRFSFVDQLFAEETELWAAKTAEHEEKRVHWHNSDSDFDQEQEQEQERSPKRMTHVGKPEPEFNYASPPTTVKGRIHFTQT
jgi:hypothetical protein